MSALRVRASGRHEEVVTDVELPDGSTAVGLLINDGGRLILALYGEQDLSVGDELVAPPDRRLAVTSVDHETVHERPVTELGVRAP